MCVCGTAVRYCRLMARFGNGKATGKGKGGMPALIIDLSLIS